MNNRPPRVVWAAMYAVVARGHRLVPLRRSRSGRPSATRCGCTSVYRDRPRRRVGRGDPGGTWTSCGPSPASSSAGASSPATCGGRRRPYSLSAAPATDQLRITVKALGDHSAALATPAARDPGVRRGPVRRDDGCAASAAQGAADRRRRRHHSAAGAVRDAAGRTRRDHAALSGQRRRRRALPARAGSLAARRGRHGSHFVTGRRSRSRLGPAVRRRPGGEHPGSARPRRLSLRPGRDDGGRTRRPAVRRGAPSADPLTNRSNSDARRHHEISIKRNSHAPRPARDRQHGRRHSCVLLGFKTHSCTSATAPPRSSRGHRRHIRRPATTTSPHRRRSRLAGSRLRQSSTGTKTVTGDAADTRYGPVQVQDHRHERASHLPCRRSSIRRTTRVTQEINSYAIPQLNSGSARRTAARRSTPSPARRTPPRVTSRRCRAPSTRRDCGHATATVTPGNRCR